MTCLLVETAKNDSIRVVMFDGVLESYNGGWLLHDNQVISEWRIRSDGTSTIYRRRVFVPGRPPLNA